MHLCKSTIRKSEHPMRKPCLTPKYTVNSIFRGQLNHQKYWILSILFLISIPFVSMPNYANQQIEKEVEQLNKDIKALKEKVKQLESKTDPDRIDEIEEAVYDVDERVGSRDVINAFEGMSVDMGGFLHSTFTYADGEDGSAQSFNRNIFELLVRVDFSEKWSAFIAQAFIRESGVNFTDPGLRRQPAFSQVGKTPQVIAWANYKHNDLLNFQFGRFITPHGIINIEHFPAVLLDTEQPLFLRPFGGQTIFPNFVNGAQIHGKNFQNNGNSIQYNLYVSEFAGNTGEQIFGGRLAYTLDQPGMTIGINASKGDRTAASSTGYTMSGIDFLIDKGKLVWKTEFFTTSEDAGLDREAYYTQPAWRLTNEWTIFYRYDFLDNGTGFGDQTENMFGVNYTPLPNVRLRATYAVRSIDEGMTLFDDDNDSSTPSIIFNAGSADVNILQFSATLSF